MANEQTVGQALRELANINPDTLTELAESISTTELDYLDGVTAGTQIAGKAIVADANVNIGVVKATALHIGATGAETQVTSTAAELNILDGVTSTAAELNILDGVTADAGEINVLDGATAGTVVASKAVVAAAAANGTAVLDFSSMTLAAGARVLLGIDLDFEAVTGWIRFNGATASGARYSAYFQPETAGTASLLGLGNTAILRSGASVNTAEAAQLHVIVQSGAIVTTRGGDSTAGIHPVWAKVSGDSGATWNTGMRIAPLWSDIQVNVADVSAEEVFGLLISAGGSGIRSLIRWEGTAPSAYLLETENAAGNGFMAAQAAAVSVVGTQQAANLAVRIGGTTYYIPLMAAA